MMIDQIDNILRRDDHHQKTMGFKAVKSPKFYPSNEQLLAEMPVDIIRTATEEHEECMKSLDDVKAQRQTKHIGAGKMSKPKSQNVIPSTVSAFQRAVPNISEDWEALPVLKEKGYQEMVEMAGKFQNPSTKQQTKVVVVQQNRQDNTLTAMLTSNRSQISDSYIEGRQNRRNQVLEKFIREVKRKGQMTVAYENKLREDFKSRQEAEEKRFQEEERQKQIELKLQQDEENNHRHQVELEEEKRLQVQQKIEEENQ